MNISQGEAKILSLRDELRRKFPNTRHVIPHQQEEEQRRQRMIVPEIIKGGVTEIVGGSMSSGAGLLLSFLMEQSAREGKWLGLVDGMDVFDPWSVAPSSLERLLWVRCHDAKHAVRAADLLLRDGNLETVLLDLQPLATREVFSVPSSSWHRLRMLAEKTGAALGVFTPCKTVPCAATRLVLEQRFHLADIDETPRTTLLKNVMANARMQSRQMMNVPLDEDIGSLPSGDQESSRQSAALHSNIPDRLKPGLQRQQQPQRKAS